MRVIACGSRTLRDRGPVWTVLTGLYEEVSTGWATVDVKPFLLIQGGQRSLDRGTGDPYGADYFAGAWARHSPLHGPLIEDEATNPWELPAMPVIHREVRADWDRLGRQAGPVRNQRMLDLLLEDEADERLVVAFVDKLLDESAGTANMVRLARRFDVPVWVVQQLT